MHIMIYVLMPVSTKPLGELLSILFFILQGWGIAGLIWINELWFVIDESNYNHKSKL